MKAKREVLGGHTLMQNWAKQREKYGSLLTASVIIALSAGLRLFFLTHNWPITNSDEGTVGLMALHIAHFTDFPVYMYGQGGTLGALEAYMGALTFPFFLGQTVFARRFGVLVLFVLFLVSMYLLTTLLYTRKLALVTLILLSMGSSDLLFRSYAALAGHAETPLFGALLVLAASKLAFPSPGSASSSARFRRLVGYGCWGMLVGAAFWNDPLTLPFILTSSLFLLVFCRHELRTPIVISAFNGLLVGLFPVVVYNLTASDITKSSLSFIGFLFNYDHPVASDTLLARFVAAFLVTLPVSTGAVPLCDMNAQSAWPLSGHASPQVLQLFPLWQLRTGACEKRRKASAQEERNRLAHDLHDSIKQQIFSIVVSALAVKRRWERDAEKPELTLSEREQNVFRLMVLGRSNREIAESLVISSETVKTHVSNILAKLHLVDRTQVVIYALKRGIIALDDIELEKK